jgi:TatA/E family protein of Tat protein translocase
MLSIPHIIVIFVVVLVIFGPEKLPELARNFGKVMAEFRRATGDLRSSFDSHMRDLEREAETRRIDGSAPAESVTAATTSPASVSTSSETPAAVAAPGTVPSDPPNAAAISAAPHTQEPGETKYAMDDAYLQGTGFEAPATAPSAEPAKPEKTPEQVTDGSARPA